jgi:energy-coupling factor transport system permease protein
LNRGYPFIFDGSDRVGIFRCIDARAKILAALVTVVLVTAILDPLAYLLLTLTLIVGCMVQRLGLSDYRRLVLMFLPMAIITLTLHLLFNRTGHEIIGSLLGLPISREALTTGLLFCWRMGLFLLAAILFTKMISADEFARGIWMALYPLRRLGIAVDGFCMAMWTAIRFIPTVFQQYHQVVFAQKARGATFDGGLVARTRKMAPLLVPITVIAIRKSDILADALIVRGWGSGAVRTFYGKGAFSLRDYAFTAGTIVWGGAILWIGL